ncbi:hypothetical protein [Pseudomonas sp. ZS001]|uniref:hypothetical protein n=2 Tax=Pseudomonas TaxID=286 RepID=UPI003139E8BD
MSRSLGLREDQRVRELLVMRIAGLFPLDPVRCHREQARSPKVRHDSMWERACSRWQRTGSSGNNPVMRITGLFPLDPVRCHREQARSPKVRHDSMWERACSR